MKLYEYRWVAKTLAKRAWVRRTYDESPFYLNVGSGLFARKNWRLLDYHTPAYPHRGFTFDYEVDLNRCEDWDIPTGRANLVYCSNCLEHLSEPAARKTLREIARVLAPGGVARVVLPDIDLAYAAYARSDSAYFDGLRNDEDRTDDGVFLGWFSQLRERDADMRQFREDFRTLDKRAFVERWSRMDPKRPHDHARHTTWFDFAKLREMAVEEGFEASKILRSGYHQSIAAEMRSPEFDLMGAEYSFYADIVR